MVEISRTGMRLATPIAVEIGQPITATLSYRDEAVTVEGVVRWRREAGADFDAGDLASWEVGIAFTAIGEASADGIWRRLAVRSGEAAES